MKRYENVNLLPLKVKTYLLVSSSLFPCRKLSLPFYLSIYPSQCIKNAILDTLFMGRTLNGNSGIVEIDLYTIAANIYIERGAHIAEGLILYGLLSLPLMAQYEQSVQTRWIHASSCVYVTNE